MSGKKVYRKCQQCGAINLNRDYCQNCGALINVSLKRDLQRQERLKRKTAETSEKPKNRVTLFFERVKEHKNPVIRFTAKFFYSIWVIVLAIGSFLAFLFGYIAA